MSANISKKDSLEQVIEKINEEIDLRRNYGVRKESLISKRLP